MPCWSVLNICFLRVVVDNKVFHGIFLCVLELFLLATLHGACSRNQFSIKDTLRKRIRSSNILGIYPAQRGCDLRSRVKALSMYVLSSMPVLCPALILNLLLNYLGPDETLFCLTVLIGCNERKVRLWMQSAWLVMFYVTWGYFGSHIGLLEAY